MDRPAVNTTRKFPTRIAAGIIVLLAACAYTPILRGGFTWDDDVLITQNRLVKAPDGLRRFWLTTEAPDYYPVTWSLWWVEWRWWDDRAAGYHVVNVLLHAINAVLVWTILRHLKIPAAGWAALLFAVHPVNVATVGWISEQKNTLSMAFYALAILFYLKFDEADHLRQVDSRVWPWYAASLGACLLALLSKTAAVMLPVVLLACLWWRQGRIRIKDLLRTLPYFAVSLAFAVVSIWFQYNRVIEGRTLRAGGFATRLAAAGWALWFYLDKALVPVNLTVVYPKWEIDTGRWISYLPGILMLGLFALFWRKRQSWGRPCLFGLGYFVATLFPVLGFFDQAFYHYSLVADHWQYSSIVGVIALAVATAEWVGRRVHARHRRVDALVIAVVVLVLSGATWKRCRVYADSEKLWRDNVAKNPAAEVAHYNLGVILEKQGRLSEAIGQFEQALRLDPDSGDTHNNLGVALWHLGRTREAISHYRSAVSLRPDLAEAHYDLGIALKQTGNVAEAIGQFEQALRCNPDYAEAHYNLANALMEAGSIDDAIHHYQIAVALKPDFAEAHYNLGVALERSGQMEEAIRQWERALQAKPDFTAARDSLNRVRTTP